MQTYRGIHRIYLNRPYAILLVPGNEDDGGWLAKIPDLPGCITFGDTKEEALEMIEDAKLTWISGRLLAGDPVPEPQPTHPVAR
jgi:antitoxin HicB